MARSETERALATTIATLAAACKRKDGLLKDVLFNSTMSAEMEMRVRKELDREGI